jgi:GNAT superfamily N-acetyltransferase
MWLQLQGMSITTQDTKARSIRICLDENGEEIGHAFLVLGWNDLHDAPWGLMDDVWIEEAHRGQGYGNELVQAVIDKARQEGCYKLLATTRNSKPEVQEWYIRLGFTDWGKEFRIDF